MFGFVPWVYRMQTFLGLGLACPIPTSRFTPFVVLGGDVLSFQDQTGPRLVPSLEAYRRMVHRDPRNDADQVGEGMVSKCGRCRCHWSV